METKSRTKVIPFHFWLAYKKGHCMNKMSFWLIQFYLPTMCASHTQYFKFTNDL